MIFSDRLVSGYVTTLQKNIQILQQRKFNLEFFVLEVPEFQGITRLKTCSKFGENDVGFTKFI